MAANESKNWKKDQYPDWDIDGSGYTKEGLKEILSNKDLLAQETLDIYSCYWSDDPDKKGQAVVRLIALLLGYINQMIKTRAPTVREKYLKEEIISACKIAILKYFPKYDPNVSTLTTYYNRILLHAIYQEMRQAIGGDTVYYTNQALAVKEAIVQLERGGNNVNVQTILQQSGLSYDAVINGLNLIKRSNVIHYDATPNGAEGLLYGAGSHADVSLSAEHVFLQKIFTETLIKALDELPEDERYILIQTFINNKTQSALAAELKVTPKTVQTKLRKAKLALKLNKELQSLANVGSNERKKEPRTVMVDGETVPIDSLDIPVDSRLIASLPPESLQVLVTNLFENKEDEDDDE